MFFTPASSWAREPKMGKARNLGSSLISHPIQSLMGVENFVT
jgi:hypothetical protein